jgi:CO dehydrogenase maturation factor
MTATRGTMTISMAGKGGTGKTTTTGLFLRAALEEHTPREILVVDADPASNIPDILGVVHPETIGSVLDRKKTSLSDPDVGCGLLREEIFQKICAGTGFDYLVMGRTTGEGCYCPLNSALKLILEETIRMYDLVLIDFDAGLEHFSRGTDTSEVLVVVTDPSRMGFETARRIRELTEELGRTYASRFLVGCRFTPKMEKAFYTYAATTGLEPLGIVPEDVRLVDLNLLGHTIFQLDTESAAYTSVRNMWNTILNHKRQER